MKKFAIMMSTYNGERFISEQLESILTQQNVVVKLIVRDDGSVDNTLKILRNFADRYKSKIEIISGNNVGWRKSFFMLSQYTFNNYPDYDFYAFSDQDDIWLPEKLYRSMIFFENSINLPQLYCSNLYYYKNGQNFGKIRNYKPIPTYKNCLLRNYATGCTTVFNYKLLELIAKNIPHIVVAHDFWFYQVACLCGKVYIDDEAYIYYRQHENNQIGSKSSIKDVWKRRLVNLKNNIKGHILEDQAKELISLYSRNMDNIALEDVKKFAQYRNSLINQFRLLLDKEYTFNIKSSDFWLKIKILLRKL